MSFKVFRDWLQQTIYKIINPIVHGMIKIGITPNFITTTGLILNIVATCIFLYAGLVGGKEDFHYIGWGGGVILFAGLFDMMDGQVARIGKMSSTFCSFWYLFLFLLSRICYQFYHYLCCTNRFFNGKLCTSSRRRIRFGM